MFDPKDAPGYSGLGVRGPFRLAGLARAAASVTIFWLLRMLFSLFLYAPLEPFLHYDPAILAPIPSLEIEAIETLSLVAAMFAMAGMERQSILAYNLRAKNWMGRLAAGFACGFLALSTLVGGLWMGGWLRFTAPELAGWNAVGSALLWAVVFLMTGFFEEGMFRCYLLPTIAGGTGFWWAALLTSLWFAAIHRNNSGESWIGLTAAGCVGFLFCVSARLTGSAWWAIGFHAAWDWAQTFFYGTADSGLVARGHWLATTPSGPARWSGGQTGPEGSLLIFPVLAGTLIGLFALAGRPGARIPGNAFPDSEVAGPGIAAMPPPEKG